VKRLAFFCLVAKGPPAGAFDPRPVLSLCACFKTAYENRENALEEGAGEPPDLHESYTLFSGTPICLDGRTKCNNLRITGVIFYLR
jgi:hypothetical protein